MNVQLEASWLARLSTEFDQPYMQQLKTFLLEEKKQGHTVYPKGSDIFAAFDATPFEQVKVVILGQDPYHGQGQAHGLCFSVQKGVVVPPSLQNMYKELKETIPGFVIPTHGYLMDWAQQGVLLLNATLTVRANQAGSHQHKGWEQFTDKAIDCLSQERDKLVFLLWGKYAQEKGSRIDTAKHLVLKAAHPSPFSAHSGFFGCKHFPMVNEWLLKQGHSAIDWSIS